MPFGPWDSGPEPRRPALDEFNGEQHRTYINLAFMSDDPCVVSQAIKEVATLRRVPCALGDNPPLADLARALRDLGLGIVVQHLDG